MSDRGRPRTELATDLKQLLRALLVTLVSVGMLLGSLLLSQLETAEEAQPSPQSVARESTITPFLPTFTPQPSPTVPPTEVELTPTQIEATTPSPTQRPPSSPTPAPTSTSTPTPAPTPSAGCTTPSSWTSYTVRRGDTLAGLARRAGVTTSTLMRSNCLTTIALQVGDSIYVPASFFAAPAPEPTVCGAPSDWITYTVKMDDTLYSIARRFDVEQEAIQRANCMQSHAIYVGQALRVPGGASVSLPGEYPAPVLISPDDGSQFPAGKEIPVRWTWEGELGEHEHFDVRLWQEGAPHYGVGWSKDGIYAVVGEPGVTYYWSVAVIRGEDGQMLEQLSPESPPRKILWGTPN